jgi:hypothetical protein
VQGCALEEQRREPIAFSPNPTPPRNAPRKRSCEKEAVLPQYRACKLVLQLFMKRCIRSAFDVRPGLASKSETQGGRASLVAASEQQLPERKGRNCIAHE